ncbi:MAG: hypothetical protein HUU28_09390 [Planctomycetaceae bacterium]|nr:hypothetical protein [Planctomycetaceae bacterium]
MTLLKGTMLFHALALATFVWMRTLGGYERIETIPIAFVYVTVALGLGIAALRTERARPAWHGVVHGVLVVVALIVLAV